MRDPPTNRKPAFLWRAMLIVLPVVVLAGVGMLSLRQDRLLAEQDARERARQLAESLLPNITQALAEQYGSAIRPAQAPVSDPADMPGAVAFLLASDGRLLHPAPRPDPLPDPLDTADLDPDLATLWQSARRAEFQDGEIDSALMTYRAFLDHEPPARFANAARISLAILAAQQQLLEPALAELHAVLQMQPHIRLESGLPAQTVAALKLIKLAQRHPAAGVLDVEWLELVCSNAVHSPSWVSLPLLDAALDLTDAIPGSPVKPWHDLWTHQERARQLHRDAHHQFLLPRSIPPDPEPASINAATNVTGADRPAPFWFVSNGNAWLAVPEPGVPGSRWIVCLPEPDIQESIESILRDAKTIPAYLGAGVIVASRPYRFQPSSVPDSQPAPVDATRLASHSLAHPILGELFVALFLDDPLLLFKRQRTRTLWFGALIAVAASAALIGLVTTWQAFRRQQLLADMQSRFVASVSHELRAPIGSIRLLAEGLESGRIRAPDKQTEYFGLMGTECRRLTALIENVLDFSRIDQGRKQYEFEPTDILALVRQTVRLMEPQAAERHVTLTLNLPSQTLNIEHPTSNGEQRTADVDLPPLDGRAIQQALVNLIDNAIKHAPPNSAVEIGLLIGPSIQPPVPDPSPNARRTQPGLRIWVADCGDGIPQPEQEKIFEPFYRRGTELRRETPGIGIGLSIVKHIVEAHGGRVTVESEPGHGSRFTLHLP